jgi:hypothetical protein
MLKTSLTSGFLAEARVLSPLLSLLFKYSVAEFPAPDS